MSFFRRRLLATVCIWLLGTGLAAAAAPQAAVSGESSAAERESSARESHRLIAATGSSALPGAGRSPLTFAVFSDVHVQSWDRQAIRKLERALDDLSGAALEAAALVLNGDLGNGDPADYITLQRLIAERPHPREVYFTIGNHEFYRMWHGADRSWQPQGFPNGESEAAVDGQDGVPF